ncbi:MAG: ImmA/IrrE family metallo-endopeptidase [Blautia sp.]|nr:ImmA/IrrE family metallo-endopeptidase [Blautia sp.]
MDKEKYLSSLVPRMFKTQFDDKATEILKDFCPEALSTPMPVPIERIATENLGLSITEHRLSEDLSILGQICFTDGLVEIYDASQDEYREIFVEAKTMIVDPDTYMKRNHGSRRNTVAHECVHWIYHKRYFMALEVLNEGRAIAHKCPMNPQSGGFQEDWSDLDWIEWQANGIAPRLLMPKETVAEAFDMIIDRSKKNPFVSAGLISKPKWILEQFSGFYQVSQTSAAIRLTELGLLS